MTEKQQLEKAISLIKSGDRQNGGKALADFLKSYPKNELAWLWMAKIIGKREQREHCLNQVLKINPDNEFAKKGLAALNQPPKKQRQSTPVPVATKKEPLAVNDRQKQKIKSSVVVPIDNEPQQSKEPLKQLKSTDKPKPKKQPMSVIGIEDQLKQLKSQQSVLLGLIGGVVGMFIGTGLWACAGMVTGYQIGFVAIAVGVTTGLGVRILGKGLNAGFGLIGGFLAIVGCVIGYYLIVANMVETFSPDIVLTIMRITFDVRDIIFWGIAAYAGYRTSYKRIDKKKIMAAMAAQ